MHLEGFSVLIVEDEILLALGVAEMLREAFCRIVGSVSTMEQALEIARRERPDLALVDLHLAHGESGLDVGRALRALGVASLLMTGRSPDTPKPEAALGCLSKPFSDETLLAAISLARRRGAGAPLPAELPQGFELY